MRGPATLRQTLPTLVKVFACATVVMLSVTVANTSCAAPQRSDSQTADLLNRLHQSRSAAQDLDYVGTFVYQQGVQLRTSRITHTRTAKSVIEKLEILDGQSQETLRNGEEIIHYLPLERRIIVERRGGERNFPDMRAVEPQALVSHYTLRPLATDRIAGRAAVGMALDPQDALRYGYRFWSDRASGLLLRAQTISEKGEVIEQIAFTQLELGKIRPSQLKTSHVNTRGWRIESAVLTPDSGSGWKAGWLPAGFRPIRVVRRVLSGSGKSGESREVVQLIFSDGLAGISVFVEPWSARHEGLPLQQGSLNMLGKRHGKFWLTIVGEVPLVTIRQVAESLEFAASDPK